MLGKHLDSSGSVYLEVAQVISIGVAWWILGAQACSGRRDVPGSHAPGLRASRKRHDGGWDAGLGGAGLGGGALKLPGEAPGCLGAPPWLGPVGCIGAAVPVPRVKRAMLSPTCFLQVSFVPGFRSLRK